MNVVHLSDVGVFHLFEPPSDSQQAAPHFINQAFQVAV